jgi:hypothetical protein
MHSSHIAEVTNASDSFAQSFDICLGFFGPACRASFFKSARLSRISMG